MTNQRLLASTAFGLLLLSACSSLPPAQINEAHWQMNGRIGLWQGQQQESSQISWLQCGNDYSKIRLSGPMGVGGAEIVAAPHGASLDFNGETQRADNAETLAADIGWPLPVAALRYWLRGQAAPNAPLSAQMSTQGQLMALQQYDWQIRFSRYSSDDSAALPQVIDAESEDRRIKLIVKSWRNAEQECQP